MTSDIDNALAPTLLDAFRSIINLDSSAIGTLKIAAGATKGDIVIVRGVVVRAWVNTSGQCGIGALKTLLSLSDCAFRFTEGEVTGERIDVYISVDELIRNKLNVDSCKNSSPEVDDLSELLRQVRFEKSQAALNEGESLETTEIPDGVYEEFIEMVREPQVQASKEEEAPANEPVLQADSNTDRGTISGSQPIVVLSPTANNHASEENSQRKLPKITGSVVVRPASEAPTSASSENSDEKVEMPDLSSWVSQSMKAITPEEAAAICAQGPVEPPLPVNAEVFDAAPPAEEPIYVNIADSHQLASLKDKRSGESSRPFAFEDDDVLGEPPTGETALLSGRNEAVITPAEPQVGARLAELNAIPTPKATPAPPPAAPPAVSSTRPVLDDSLTTSSRQRMVQSMERTASVTDRVSGAIVDGSLNSNNFVKLGGMLALIAVFVLSGALIYVPTTMKNEAARADSADLAQNQIDMVIQSNTANAVPYIKE